MASNDNQFLIKIIQVLDCFNGETNRLGVMEISNNTGIPYSTTGRLLQNLKAVGLLNQDTKTKEYSLGAKVLLWAGSYLNTMDLIEISQPYLYDLQLKTQETVSLYILDHYERMCIFRKESSHSIRMVARIGERMPLHLGAAGTLFLFHFSDFEREKFFKEKNISSEMIKKLEKHFSKIKAQGYSTSYGERVTEAASIAAPIYNIHKEMIAVVNISGPIQRFDEKTIQKYSIFIVAASEQISHDLGYVGEG